MTDFKNYSKANVDMQQKVVKNLIYFSYNTRPDIAFVVGQLSKYNDKPKKSLF